MSETPFTGFVIDTPWPEPAEATHPKARKLLAKGRHAYLVAARVEPVPTSDALTTADANAENLVLLQEFGQAVVNRLPGMVEVGRPEEGDRSICFFFEVLAKHPMGAISSCAFRLDRAVKKTARDVLRVTWDTKDVT